MPKNASEMTVIEHLEELRKRLIRVLISVGTLSIASYFFSEILLDFLTRPADDFVNQFYFFEPASAFLIRLKLAFFAGVFLSIPLILYETWLFVSPGLYKSEKGIIFPASIVSTVLFLVGAGFAYFLIIPLAMQLLLNFQTRTLKPLLDIENYLRFTAVLLIGTGIVFDFPVFLIGLVKLHVLKPETLKRSRKVVLLGVLLLTAIITPGDVVVAQLLLTIPILLLYEISILAAVLIVKSEHQKKRS